MGVQPSLAPAGSRISFLIMADDDEPTFETADSGASHTYPQQAGEIKKGSHLMIKGEPTEDDEKVTKELLEGLDAGKQVTAIVLSACGKEKVIQVKVTDG